MNCESHSVGASIQVWVRDKLMDRVLGCAHLDSVPNLSDDIQRALEQERITQRQANGLQAALRRRHKHLKKHPPPMIEDEP